VTHRLSRGSISVGTQERFANVNSDRNVFPGRFVFVDNT